MAVAIPFKWRRTPDIAGDVNVPRPRHGHRAVQIKELIIVFGGGNEGIVDELHVYNTTQNAWFIPVCKGDTPPGCAAFGFAVENTRLLVHGGMIEYGRYSGELYELQATKWEWKKLRPKTPKNGPPPCPRLGHSFTILNKKIYLFGGLCNNSPDPKAHAARYLNDLYVLDISKTPHQWEIPETNGTPPGPRESHTAVIWKKNEGTPEQKDFLVIYGGMCGARLGDLWLLELDSLTWQKPVVVGTQPFPRSLHTAVVGSNKMYVFGGWIRRDCEKDVEANDGALTALQKEWKCTNTLGIFDLEHSRWDHYRFPEKVEVPRPRAGHCAAIVHNRMYVWSGRDGYKKINNNQVCCNDMWFLETQKPSPPGKVQLLKATTTQLDVHWTPSQTAEAYRLELQVYETPGAAASTTSQAAKTTAAANSTPSTPPAPAGTGAAKPQTAGTITGKNLPQGAQFVTLTKPGTTQGITLTPGSAVPVSGMVKLVPQAAAATGTPTASASAVKPTATPSNAAKPTGDSKPAEAGKPDGESGKPAEGPLVDGPANGEGSHKDTTVKQEPDSDKTPPASRDASVSSEPSSSETKPTPPAEPVTAKEKPKDEGTAKQWFPVAVLTDPAGYAVQAYYVPTAEEEVKMDLTFPVEKGKAITPQNATKCPLLPGTAYKFRVAAINSCGESSWSEMSAFKTCLPGFPGAPSNIKITKCPEGALLTWEPPTNHGDNISEYAVYLATKPNNAKPDVAIPTNQLSFVKVYDDPTPTCVITLENLRHAYYDTSGAKPAIIFRIAAKNDKGYGPATQVRWLQGQVPDSACNS